ncbi:uncharacterized protein LOC127120280 [Lathyrus oleraceus]|uniref:uncharacterized protein LOC127120280 n=1 Tax=Pisum sativum TaxID=3888 RepID=UPI0021CED30E|nr:uncharacterized protein LOC127120280 [Pisum sativum]XP_050906647.1 uncharacterized protein LOC127120280 [Pisum sativum]
MSKKKTVANMEAKIADLEQELSLMKVDFSDSIAEVQQTARENQRALIQMMEKVLEKKVVEAEDDASLEKVTTTTKLKGEALDEFRRSVKKVELPVFSGDDPAGWISRAEVYFHVQDTSATVKVGLAQLSMEGPTIHFFNSLLEENRDLTWEELRSELMERYGGLGEGDVYEKLTEIRQRGTMEEYIQEFERLTSQIPRLPDKQFLGYFLHELRGEIRGRVRSFVAMGPIARTKLFHVTRAVERETSGGSGWIRNPKPSGSNKANSGRNGGTDWVFVKGGQNSGLNYGNGPKGPNNPPCDDKPVTGERKKGGARDKGFTHLSYQELMNRKQKGLCYKCGGPFHPLHQCPDKQLRVMILDDEDGGEEEAKLLAVEVDESEKERDGEMSVMNLYEMEVPRRERLQTLKLRATINGVPVVVLIGSGATHNFIAKLLVQKLSWRVETTPDFIIKLGDGFQTTTRGKCNHVLFKIGEVTSEIEAYLFDLEGVGVVLGMAWLKSLGDMIVNWKKQTMEFWHEGKWVMLKGIEGTSEAISALQSIVGKASKGYGRKWWSLDATLNNTETQVLQETDHPEMKERLKQFDDVFHEPKGLPPRRSRDHSINLLPGQGPVSVRPYRYPPSSKK